MNKFAVIYARQSSGAKDESESVETQLANCKDYCKAYGLKIRGVFKDCNTSGHTYPLCFQQKAESDSAFQDWFAEQTQTTKYRAGLSEALEALQDGDVLVLDDLTRLCRPIEGSHLGADLTYFLKKRNVLIHLANGKLIDPASSLGSMFQTITSHINNEQILNGTKKSLEIRHRMQDEGIWISDFKAKGLEPLGDHRYRIRPEYLPCIQYVFNSVLAGMTYSHIQHEVNRQYSGLFGKAFYQSNFYHMVEQPLYAGHMRNTRGEIIKCTGLVGAPAVPIDVWRKAQHILEEKRSAPCRGVRGDHIIPFSRKILCGKCNAVMSILRDKVKAVYYACLPGTNLHKDHDCSRSRVRISDPKSEHYTGLQHALCPLLIMGQYAICQESTAKSQVRREYDKIRADIDAALNGIPQVKTEVLMGETDAEVGRRTVKLLSDRLAKLRNRENELRAMLETDHRKMMLDDPAWGNFTAILENRIDDATYKQLLDRVLDNVVCHEDHVMVNTKYGAFRLDRYAGKKGRCFPKFTWKIIRDNKEVPKDISKCRLEVTYHYNDTKSWQILINFPIMKIVAAV